MLRGRKEVLGPSYQRRRVQNAGWRPGILRCDTNTPWRRCSHKRSGRPGSEGNRNALRASRWRRISRKPWHRFPAGKFKQWTELRQWPVTDYQPEGETLWWKQRGSAQPCGWTIPSTTALSSLPPRRSYGIVELQDGIKMYQPWKSVPLLTTFPTQDQKGKELKETPDLLPKRICAWLRRIRRCQRGLFQFLTFLEQQLSRHQRTRVRWRLPVPFLCVSSPSPQRRPDSVRNLSCLTKADGVDQKQTATGFLYVAPPLQRHHFEGVIHRSIVGPSPADNSETSPAMRPNSVTGRSRSMFDLFSESDDLPESTRAEGDQVEDLRGQPIAATGISLANVAGWSDVNGTSWRPSIKPRQIRGQAANWYTSDTPSSMFGTTLETSSSRYGSVASKSQPESWVEDSIASSSFHTPASKEDVTLRAAGTEECPICLDFPGAGQLKTLSCGHSFCRTCIAKSLGTRKACPVCGRTGWQPKKGKMSDKVDKNVKLIGYESCGTIVITYSFVPGIQRVSTNLLAAGQRRLLILRDQHWSLSDREREKDRQRQK